MLCLIHLRSAAVIVAVTVGLPFVIFFASTGISTFLGAAINVMLLTVATVIIVLIQYRDFTRMIGGQKRAEQLSNENLRLANLDSLTDLPNRRAFFTHLGCALQIAQSEGSRLALGIIEIGRNRYHDAFEFTAQCFLGPTDERAH